VLTFRKKDKKFAPILDLRKISKKILLIKFVFLYKATEEINKTSFARSARLNFFASGRAVRFTKPLLPIEIYEKTTSELSHTARRAWIFEIRRTISAECLLRSDARALFRHQPSFRSELASKDGQGGID
jgi:hypothetical protein